MKTWLSRLFGGADAAPARPHTPAPAPATPQAPIPKPAASGSAGAGVDLARIDLAYCRWLTEPVRGDATPDTEARILAELRRLAGDPAAAGELVPRVPAVVPQLLKSLRDESASSGDLARQIARDAVLVAEVIREANGPLFRRSTPVRTIDGAVVVLGENGLRILLARVAFRPIINMQGGLLARRVAPRLWMQSDTCALAASLLAAECRADPFEAYLAGLMGGVGLIAAVRLIDHLDQPLVPQSDAFCQALLATARALSAGIASQWGLPSFVAAAILEAGQSGAGPLADTLGHADLLAKLRLLVDHGIYASGEEPVASLLAGPAGRHFERLAATAAS
jgi:HD-like signal output (HDOD) protein